MIDINCDVGEGLENEHLIMPLISSCNISCGAHAGSIEIIDKVLKLAIDNNVKVGAHPSFLDNENFGRKVLDISNDSLKESIIDQLLLFKERAVLQNVKIHHIKPHGALYNLIAINEEIALVVIAAIKSVFNDVKIYVPYQSKIEKVALENGLEIIYEAFADRNYNDDLTLVSRLLPNAIISEKEKVLSHIIRMIDTSRVKTVQDNVKEIKVNTFCIHGDHKNTVDILEFLHQHIKIA